MTLDVLRSSLSEIKERFERERDYSVREKQLPLALLQPKMKLRFLANNFSRFPGERLNALKRLLRSSRRSERGLALRS